MKNKIVSSFALGLVITSFVFAGGEIPFDFEFTARGGLIPAVDGDQNGDGISTFQLIMSDPRITEINSLELQLTGLTHSFPDDLDVYLISPAGLTLEVMLDSGGDTAVQNITLIFNDAGATTPPDESPLVNGATYKPEGSPPGMSLFVGPTGRTDTWLLLIVDDAADDRGSLESWTLRGNGVPEPMTLSLLALGALAFVRRRRA